MIESKIFQKIIKSIYMPIIVFWLSIFVYVFVGKTYQEMNYYRNLNEIYSQIEIAKKEESL